MSVPGAENAIVEDAKLVEYLLSPTHPIGRFKSAFFNRLGFNQSNAQNLKAELLRIIRESEIVETAESRYGLKYRVDGELHGPSGLSATIVTVWIAVDAANRPRFITAYPGG